MWRMPDAPRRVQTSLRPLGHRRVSCGHSASLLKTVHGRTPAVPKLHQGKAMALRKGVPVSPGIAVAQAYCVDEVLARREPLHLDRAALSGEVGRFDRACAAAARELDAIVERVSKQVGEEEAGIFRAHRMLIRDPA